MSKPKPALTVDGVADTLNDAAARDRVNLYLQMLKSLAMTGMDLATDVARHTRGQLARVADGGWEPDLAKGPGSAFVKLSLCVRRTIALDLHIRERLEPGAGNPFAERVSRTLTPATPAKSEADPVLDRQPKTSEDVTGRALFRRELGRIYDPPQDFAGDRSRPVFQTIAKICEDMGLETGWTRFHPDTCIVYGQAYEPKAPWIIRPKAPVSGVPACLVYPHHVVAIDDDDPDTGAPLAPPVSRRLC